MWSMHKRMHKQKHFRWLLLHSGRKCTLKVQPTKHQTLSAFVLPANGHKNTLNKRIRFHHMVWNKQTRSKMPHKNKHPQTAHSANALDIVLFLFDLAPFTYSDSKCNTPTHIFIREQQCQKALSNIDQHIQSRPIPRIDFPIKQRASEAHSIAAFARAIYRMNLGILFIVDGF